MTLDAASARQHQAAEPWESTWLSANAGSGKTRVLTDRVARLLLGGVDPQNILCLTYTKAAASEMQNRLFGLLGNWAMKPDGALAAELVKLGVTDDVGASRLAEARRLFARAIETPGGLRIQTIHSFCASLLRRFPLEAGVTPGFSEIDDRTATLMQEAVVEELAEAHPAVFDGIARHLSGDDLGPLIEDILKHREAFRHNSNRDEVLAWFGLASGSDFDTVLSTAFNGSEPGLARDVADIAAGQSKTYAEFGAALLALDLANPDADKFATCCDLFLYKSGEQLNLSKSSNWPQSNHKKAVAAFQPILPELHAFMDRVAEARQVQFALSAVERTLALHRFGHLFLTAYEDRKRVLGRLDFDDLIERTRTLLANPQVAAWVLYRLDGGLDHILVDEAQDTSPAQWQVIERLAQEFTAGQGARDGVPRTIFVVGDKKQSIYSFQGADPREFDRMQAHFAERLARVGVALRPLELEYSFRSSEAILRFVDQTGPIPDMRHRAFFDSMPGRVDWWPPVATADKPEKRDWYDSVDIVARDHPTAILARAIAEQVGSMLRSGTIPAGNGGTRPVRAGDILVLVRRRSDLFHEIIRALKAAGLPVAGADRLRLGAELAVRDIAAVLRFLATPEDDLSLAAALRSPLFGWTEARLYALAQGRGDVYLWQALRDRAAEFPQALEILDDLRRQADFLRPYDLIERLLLRHDGRRRLLARLGPEAQDGIDSLLSQALAYETQDVPSLTGFLTWLDTDDVDVKRQMDSAGDQIRVMTVHGAKGLESPIVILPDTAKRVFQNRGQVLGLPGGGVGWKPLAASMPSVMAAALAQARAQQEEEDRRLHYVAATRAECWLIYAAAGDTGQGDDSWHSIAEAGLRALGAEQADMPTGPGLRLSHADWGGERPAPDTLSAEKRATAVPDWAEAQVRTPDRPDVTLAPSSLGGAKALAGAEGAETEAALEHGTQVHRLLELLPAAPPERRAELARALSPDSSAIAEALGVLRNPALAHVFAPDTLAEVDLSATLDELGGQRIAGAIDRLVIGKDVVLAVDFKTNALVPDRPQAVPEGILRQMGAYAAGLARVFPDRRIEVAILWTRSAQLMPLPHEIVRDALRRTATS